MIYRSDGRRTRSVLFAALILSSAGLEAATRPVSIAVGADFDHNLARSANIGWSRINIVWSFINPQPGVWHWVYTDERINSAVASGQQILGILQRPPQWVGGGVNENVPPVTTTQWSEYVRRVAQRYAGRIAAYEIWNEPDQKKTNQVGIGWGRNVEEPPRYVDFVHAAAVEIRAQAPGTLVVAPTFMSRNNASGADNRKKRILQQIQAAVYPGGPGYSFVNVLSAHNNAGDTEASRIMGRRLNYENLAYVWNHAPSLRTAPVWVTEYGWRSNAVGEPGQRERICNVTKMYTGRLDAAFTDLDDWDVRRAFIYGLKIPGSSASIFRADNSPKPVVTQYIQRLAYPAVQNPALSAEFPSCSGTSPAGQESEPPELSAEDVAASFVALGLLDPRSGLPTDYSQLFAERSPDGGSIDVAYEDAMGATVSVSVSPASPENQARRDWTDAGSEWTSGSVHISVSGMASGSPIGKAFIATLGAAIDPSFHQACMIESVSAGEGTVEDLGFSPPASPAGFTKRAVLLELTRPTAGCGAEVSTHSPIIDFTWTLEGGGGEVINAGIYRYGDGPGPTFVGPSSLHWSNEAGARFWVAAEAPEMTESLKEALYSVAKSMDPELQP